MLLGATGTVRAGELTGVVQSEETGEPLAGVTVSVIMDEAVTDESGEFRISNLPPGTYPVVFFHGATVVKRSVEIGSDGAFVMMVALPGISGDRSVRPTIRSAPIIEEDADIVRRRDLLFHLPRPSWRFPLPADTRVEGVPWPAGAPPPPDAFVDELTLWHAGLLARRGVAVPAADVVLQSASNEQHVLLATRRTRGQAESVARLSGPIALDYLWYTVAVAAGPSLAGLARLHYAPSSEHQLATFAYVDRRPENDPPQAAAAGVRPSDQVIAAATWRSRFDDHNLDLTLTAATTRFASASLARRQRLLGHHVLNAGVERSAAWIEDSWQPRQDWTVELGLRYQHADRSVHPRAGVVWDWTGQGRARAFAAASGAELFGGAEYEVIEDLALHGSWRHTRTEHGPGLGARLRGNRRSAGLRYELDHAASDGKLTSRLFAYGFAELDLWSAGELFAGLYLARAVRGLPPGSDSAGLQLGKRIEPTRELALSLAADLVATAGERTVWLALRIER